jgi:dTMP kinase
MLKKKFYFIVFEGIEGTGKSYQINKLYKNLKKLNLDIVKTREPGGSFTAEKIRKLIFGKKSNYFDKLTDFYLMLASRNEHIKKTIIPAIKKKQILISDRFVDSTYAYQVIGNKINKKINLINQKYILNNIKPNITIVLRSNFKSIASRLKKRKKKNKFDKLKIKFYKIAQKAFINIANMNKKRYIVLDSSENTKNLEKKILTVILSKIK